MQCENWKDRLKKKFKGRTWAEAAKIVSKRGHPRLQCVQVLTAVSGMRYFCNESNIISYNFAVIFCMFWVLKQLLQHYTNLVCI